MFKAVIEKYLRSALTISTRDADVVRDIVLESGISLSQLQQVFRQLSRHTYTRDAIPVHRWADVASTDICRVLDRKDMGSAAYIFDELHARLLAYRDTVVPVEWYTNIHLIVNRM